ncbi:DUF2935 domain-containing protein [Geobacillus proteiniphilus]|uniref:DUF2935 domain-containing protein n=1 Tax=Geobacillus proteiniphilus TaxID=860353 RepID=A0ABY9MJX4_9BACL|nr:DUF2935 domain-containing protein [Geobacillus proteiniphilus]WMJ18250.1 DUF2935 domain-containing protein [Geobacillus proteiniphilus]
MQTTNEQTAEQEALFELRFLSPLMADHMAREECYYLQKLAETTGEVKPTACDLTKPRTE